MCGELGIYLGLSLPEPQYIRVGEVEGARGRSAQQYIMESVWGQGTRGSQEVVPPYYERPPSLGDHDLVQV